MVVFFEAFIFSGSCKLIKVQLLSNIKKNSNVNNYAFYVCKKNAL